MAVSAGGGGSRFPPEPVAVATGPEEVAAVLVAARAGCDRPVTDAATASLLRRAAHDDRAGR